jgi:hypothetical protein
MSDGGKGSKPRPFSVSQEEFADRFDTIFSKKKKTDTEQEVPLQDLEEAAEEFHSNELEEYKRQAQEIWNDSCTSPRKK